MAACGRCVGVPSSGVSVQALPARVLPAQQLMWSHKLVPSVKLWALHSLHTCCAGNTFVLKPSEQDPGCAVLLAQLAQEAGLPNGVLNIGAA